MVLIYNIERVHHTTMINLNSKLISSLILIPLIPQVIEDLVVKSALVLHGYYMPKKLFIGLHLQIPKSIMKLKIKNTLIDQITFCRIFSMHAKHDQSKT